MRPPFSQRQDPQNVERYFEATEAMPLGMADSAGMHVINVFYAPNPLGGMILERDIAGKFQRIHGTRPPSDPQTFFSELISSSEYLIDALDFCLEARGRGFANILKTELTEARSTLTIGDDPSGRPQLEYRQPPELTELVQEIGSTTGRPGAHLTLAWNAAFGLNPDPNKAADEANKAIEVAAKPLVSPNNGKVTLGTLVRDMRAKPSKWETDLDLDDDDDIVAIISMLDMAWRAQYRHGNETDPIEISQQAAEMIVHQAIVLVHWFTASYIKSVK